MKNTAAFLAAFVAMICVVVHAADPDKTFRDSVRAAIDTNGMIRIESLPSTVTQVASNNAVTLTNVQGSAVVPAGSAKVFTNVVWDAGAATGNWTFVNGRLITP